MKEVSGGKRQAPFYKFLNGGSGAFCKSQPGKGNVRGLRNAIEHGIGFCKEATLVPGICSSRVAETAVITKGATRRS